METPLMMVGSIVVANCTSDVCDVGEMGVCYESYALSGRAGYSIIFASGRHDGFSPEDIAAFLTVTDRVCDEISGYQFRNVIQLERDWQAGWFAPAFAVPLGGGRPCAKSLS